MKKVYEKPVIVLKDKADNSHIKTEKQRKEEKPIKKVDS